MPEYLAPGVYVEEVSFRSKSIEGVPTSTTGFAGMTRYGPVQYSGGPRTTEPRLITSFTGRPVRRVSRQVIISCGKGSLLPPKPPPIMVRTSSMRLGITG